MGMYFWKHWPQMGVVYFEGWVYYRELRFSIANCVRKLHVSAHILQFCVIIMCTEDRKRALGEWSAWE